MVTPQKFQQKEYSQLSAVIREHPFASLLTYSEAGIEANHIPTALIQRNGKDVIQAHIAKANPLWKSIGENSNVLLTFHGPQCYISPNHYPTKQETGKAVPTWNYVVVHVRGKISFIHDDELNYQVIDTLTNNAESDQQEPWSVSDAPDKYIKRMLSAIVGLEVTVDSIEGQWKLSQNQPDINRLGVIQGLSEKSDDLSKSMSQLVKDQL